MRRFLAPVGFVLLSMLAACLSAVTPPAHHSSLGAYDPSITYDGGTFVPAAGPVRGDLLNLSQLTPTDLVLESREVRRGTDGTPVNAMVYGLPDAPLADGFLVLWLDRGFGPATHPGGGFNYPSCPAGSGAYVFAEEGVAAPPYSPGPEYPGGPTPTPPPTPDTPIVPMVLTAEGLLTAGWPGVNLERASPTYRGTVYEFARHVYINETGADSAISSSTLEKLETLPLAYPVTVRQSPSSALSALLLPGPVTDRVNVYRLKQTDGPWKGWPAGKLLFVDVCPVGVHPDQFTLYEPAPPDDGPRSTPTAPGTQTNDRAPTTTLTPTPTEAD